jgi:hypothetical protein
VAGHGTWAAVSWVYNYPIYVSFVAWLGPIVGGGIMMLGSLVICFGMVVWYDRKKVDWLGVGAVDAVRELVLHYAEKLATKTSIFVEAMRIVMFIATLTIVFIPKGFVDGSQVLAFLAGNKLWIGLSAVFFTPIRLILLLARLVNHKFWGDVIAFFLLSIFEDPFITTAYLRHGKFGNLGANDWTRFVASVAVSNGWWILRTTAVVEIARFVWKSIRH